MSAPFSELLREDPLTGCKNYLGFLETLADHSLPGAPADGRLLARVGKFKINSSLFSAILFADMNDLKMLNESKGRAYGDSALRWMGILLQEETERQVYRIGGDEFAVLLKLDSHKSHLEMIERLLKRMDREARNLGFPGTAADIALIYFDLTPDTLDAILLKMGEAMARVKNKEGAHYMAFNTRDFALFPQVPTKWKAPADAEVTFSFRWLLLNNIYQVLEMGRILDDTQQEAYTDAISGLPNMKAALRNMEKALDRSKQAQRPYSILLIDGDDIRIYNSINYAAGDEMIRDLSAVFKNNLRPSDYVARWRTGDEFMVILPDTSIEGAKTIAERFCQAVKEASAAWKFPVTISIGIANYPLHADNVNALIDKAEAANKQAKDRGKDRVVLAE